MTFADELRPYMEKEGLTYSDVARQMHRSRQWFGSVANGSYVPTNPDTIHEIARIVGAPPEQLMLAAGKIPEDIHAWILDDRTSVPRIRTLMEET